MDQHSADIKYEEEFIVNSRGNKLFTCRWTPQNHQPKALIFICHGVAGECSISMRDTAARLVPAGNGVYGIDHEGHGRSSGRKCYIPNFNDVVSDCSVHFMSICDKSENRGKKRYLYGISMGGSVALLLHRKAPDYWDGAVSLAPMCKVSDDMRPHPIVVSALTMICAIAPSWRIIPTPDIIDKVCKDPETRKQVRSNPYIYRGKLPLKTCHELLMVSLDIEKNLDQVTMPFLVLHGGDDIVTELFALRFPPYSSTRGWGSIYIEYLLCCYAYWLLGYNHTASEKLPMAQYRDDIRYEEDFVVNSRGNRLFTCRWMPKEMEPKALIFICHGYGGECSVSMGDTAARLVHSGYAVYGIDHEGHGKSSGSKGYISNFSNIVKDCSDYFKTVCEKPRNRLKKRFLYGFSMGGTVVLQLHRRDPLYWDGAVLLAPMCKISDDMRPPSFVVSALKMISAIAPSWRVIPSPDMMDKVCKDPQFKKEIRSNPYMYRGNLALQTGHELLTVSLDIEKNLQEVSLPFLVLHGEDDIVADPSGSKLLRERASSRDKTLKLYPGMWHVLMGEQPEDVDRVFADVITWLEDRAGGTAKSMEMNARDGQVMVTDTL